jgi:hypothetical protein
MRHSGSPCGTSGRVAFQVQPVTSHVSPPGSASLTRIFKSAKLAIGASPSLLMAVILHDREALVTRAAYTGHEALTFTDYLDLGTGRTLAAEPGGVYDVAPASGRVVPEIPEPWFVPLGGAGEGEAPPAEPGGEQPEPEPEGGFFQPDDEQHED